VKTIEVLSNQHGFFRIKNIRGADLYIKEIEKDGFEYLRCQNPVDSFDYAGAEGVAFLPDLDNPVIFRMRKKLQNRTFLFWNRDWGLGINRDGSGEDRAYDFVEQKRTRPADRLPKKTWSEHCDLRYRATYDETLGEWEVVFTTCGAGSGILADDEKLYEAPEGEYRGEWSFMARDMDLPKDHFLYVKSRTPSIYSRVEITDIRVTREHVRIYGSSTTNPYGDRVLDSVDMDSLTSHQRVVLKARLEAEARAMLAGGRLPPRPKIIALMEAVKRGDKTLEELKRETHEWKTEKNPNYTTQYWRRAHEKMKMRDFEGAIKEFDEYLRRASSSSRDLAYSTKGRALEQLGDFEGAVECYHSALEEFPEKLALFLPKLVSAREKLGQVEQALVDLEKLSRRYEEIKTQRLKEIEKELALLEERPNPGRSRKLYSEKMDLAETLESWKGRNRKERKRLEEKLRQQQSAP
jgi:TolA-binding protein